MSNYDAFVAHLVLPINNPFLDSGVYDKTAT